MSSERRRVLSGFLEGNTRFGGSRECLKYGKPASPARLQALASAIASRVNWLRSQGNPDFADAVYEMRTDLMWLQDTYYKQLKCSFEWPKIQAR